jgi:hypothetical protein
MHIHNKKNLLLDFKTLIQHDCLYRDDKTSTSTRRLMKWPQPKNE